jgi:hypothetical protein
MQRNLRRHVLLHAYELRWADKVHPIHPLPSRSQSEAMWTRYLRSYQPPCSTHATATDGTISGCPHSREHHDCKQAKGI